MSLRLRRQLLGLACHMLSALACLVWIGLGQAVGSPDLMAFSALALVVYSLTWRLNPLPRLVQGWAIRQTKCLACGEIIELVDTWQCGCGFTSWQPRHVCSPCPHCRKVFRWLVCPNCQASIPV